MKREDGRRQRHDQAKAALRQAEDALRQAEGRRDEGAERLLAAKLSREELSADIRQLARSAGDLVTLQGRSADLAGRRAQVDDWIAMLESYLDGAEQHVADAKVAVVMAEYELQRAQGEFWHQEADLAGGQLWAACREPLIRFLRAAQTVKFGAATGRVLRDPFDAMGRGQVPALTEDSIHELIEGFLKKQLESDASVIPAVNEPRVDEVARSIVRSEAFKPEDRLQHRKLSELMWSRVATTDEESIAVLDRRIRECLQPPVAAPHAEDLHSENAKLALNHVNDWTESVSRLQQALQRARDKVGALAEAEPHVRTLSREQVKAGEGDGSVYFELLDQVATLEKQLERAEGILSGWRETHAREAAARVIAA